MVLAASAGASVYAWLPWSSPPARLAIYFVSLAIVPWGLGAMTMIGYSLILRQHRTAATETVRLPRAYWKMLLCIAAYFFALLFGGLIYFPLGVSLGPSMDLRIASAFCLLFAVASLGYTQWSGLRARALQAAA
ncbi:MAG: hypothetical protein ABWY48_02555 [Pseudoxanthomonas sp.]